LPKHLRGVLRDFYILKNNPPSGGDISIDNSKPPLGEMGDEHGAKNRCGFRTPFRGQGAKVMEVNG